MSHELPDIKNVEGVQFSISSPEDIRKNYEQRFVDYEIEVLHITKKSLEKNSKQTCPEKTLYHLDGEDIPFKATGLPSLSPEKVLSRLLEQESQTQKN